jgi:hypothetical protein
VSIRDDELHAFEPAPHEALQEGRPERLGLGGADVQTHDLASALDATRALVRMLPLTIEMRDHLRQEKTGNLPSPLPAVERRLDFRTGTLGLWSSNHFVIYYREGRVPQPGIILLGRVMGDVSIFDRPGPVTVRVERID